jgi:hypothetical protein
MANATTIPYHLGPLTRAEVMALPPEEKKARSITKTRMRTKARNGRPRARDPEKALEYGRKHREANREKLNEKNRAAYQKRGKRLRPKKVRHPSARASARAQGLDHYFTGIACPKGHVAARSVSKAECIECRNAHRSTRRPHVRDLTPEQIEARNAVRRVENISPEQRARQNQLCRAKRQVRIALQLGSIPPWQDREELKAFSEACPPGYAVDHRMPRTAPYWCGKVEHGDSLLWAIPKTGWLLKGKVEVDYDAQDIFGRPISTRLFSTLEIVENLDYLPEKVNSSKLNKLPHPNSRAWFTSIEAQTNEPLQPGMWSDAWAMCEDGSIHYLTDAELSEP